METSVVQNILREKLIVIIRGVEQEYLTPLVQALYRGGIRLVEVTYCADGTISNRETADSIQMLCEKFDDLCGGKVIISPDCNPETIYATKQQGMVSIPGAFTPTEAQLAHRSGADFVKLFPVVNMGVAYIRALMAPLSHIRFLAVGGIDDKNMPAYLQAGVCGFGVGTNITNRRMIAEQEFAGISMLATEYVKVLHGNC